MGQSARRWRWGMLLFCSLLWLWTGASQAKIDTAQLSVASPALHPSYSASGRLLYYSDTPGSLFQPVATEIFPGVRSVWVPEPISLADNQDSFWQVMPEHEAYPLLAHQGPVLNRSFEPLYRATVVLATDRNRFNQDIQSWNHLRPERLKDATVGLMANPEYILAAMGEKGRAGERSKPWLDALRALDEAGRLKVYHGRDANSLWPEGFERGALDPSSLPAVLVLWDYQVAQINLRLRQERYSFHVPAEGSMYVDVGIFANGAKAVDVLAAHLGEEARERADQLLLEYGYRLTDGRSARNHQRSEAAQKALPIALQRPLGYPPDTEYQLRERSIENNLAFNQSLMNNRAVFRRAVLQAGYLTPSNGEEEQVVLILSIPLMLLWIASIYYRLDEAAIRRPMLALLAGMAMWIFIYFMRVMYWHLSIDSLLDSVRLFPHILMLAAWFRTGINLAVMRGRISRLVQRLSWLPIAAYLGMGAYLVWTFLHGQALEVDDLGRIIHIGPSVRNTLLLGGAMVLGAHVLFIHANQRRRNLSAHLPLLLMGLAIAANALYFYQGGRITDGFFDLLNNVFAVLVLETALFLRLIPVNTSYFKLFRSSPVRLRLMDHAMSTLYPKERGDIPGASLERIKAALRTAVPEGSKWSKALDDEAMQPLRIPSAESEQLQYGAGRLSGGYVLWEEDISDIISYKAELSASSDQLAQQHKILQKQKEIRSRLLSMQLRRKMLRSVERSLSDKMEEIGQSIRLIKRFETKKDLAGLRKELGRVKIMVSQSKRKSNLLLRDAETLAMAELRLILKEALADAGSAGIQGMVICPEQGSLPMETVLLLYDFVQMLLQRAALLESSNFFMTLARENGYIQLQLIYHSRPDVSEGFFEREAAIQERMKEAKAEQEYSVEDQDHRLRLRLFYEEQPDV